MQPRRAALDVLTFAAAVRAGALEAGRREPLPRVHHRRLAFERRTVQRVDDDELRCALEELLDAIDRVLVLVEMGDPVDGAVRELDVRAGVVERFYAYAEDVARRACAAG